VQWSVLGAELLSELLLGEETHGCLIRATGPLHLRL